MATTVDRPRPAPEETEPATGMDRGATRTRPSPFRSSWRTALVVATGLFMGSLLVSSLMSGGLKASDFGETTVPALAVAQGTLPCAYPASNKSPIPPLYPLVAGSIMKVTGIGAMTFPSSSPTEKSCPTGNVSAFAWRGPLVLIWLIGLLGWPVLLTGLLLLFRASGLVRSRRVVIGCCLIAITPPAAAAVVPIFHPEDLFAMGLILAGLAAALRQRWLAAGVLIALACCTKQYAVLAAIPLAMVVPNRNRWRFLGGAMTTAVVVLVPLGLLMGRGLVAALAGVNATPAGQNGVIGMVDDHTVRIALARGCPLLLGAALALWARRRLGEAVLEPSLLIALVATSLALRLVFEVSIFDYYFLALTVALVAGDVIRGRIQFWTMVWLVGSSLFFAGDVGFIGRMVAHSPGAIQMVVVLPGLALAARPLWRARPDAARGALSVEGNGNGVSASSGPLAS